VKGLLVAALVHGTYNTLVDVAPGVLSNVLGLSPLVAFLAFVVAYDCLRLRPLPEARDVPGGHGRERGRPLTTAD
jgi:RsiW-degrading membrane proteinase PrsW (M82 family)